MTFPRLITHKVDVLQIFATVKWQSEMPVIHPFQKTNVSCSSDLFIVRWTRVGQETKHWKNNTLSDGLDNHNAIHALSTRNRNRARQNQKTRHDAMLVMERIKELI